MYIRKSVLRGIAAIAGIIILAAVAVLYCFTEISIPMPVYAAVWFGCLAVMLACSSGTH
ncbi:hypothetical protein H6B07_13020 [Mediterraneibacter glycyrrhizinilyticus]|uniref:Uncharacterized protein n=1 Tax=Candidatus Mediterraneibacter faecipullorum TaxID=2838670 RepID=A0A9D2NK79_9FIRM|nr:hypothetical protein [Mediterraneibacter glycyrrhizinilyticus]MBM6803559.1 hypothetical protein [Mediterraneibacter glycyrrhizinilyticus]MDM8125047.1 hypothetical protein [Mediterraneibacter glycyrrhizinilyticus]MDM8209370.1 hypothetical protein [Mediterraneibacter glycyrrhizinilyticus]HJC33184.1 hypothetical protein [Candidatus Mediterraneibacter faecipullorum]